MASNYRIVEIPSVYGSSYRVDEQFLLFFWLERRLCSTLKDAMAEIDECKTRDNLPRERVIYNDALDYKEPLPEKPPAGPPPAPKMRNG